VLSAVSLFGQTKITARSAGQFVDSMGVNIHMEATNTPYNNYALINRKLQELGMRHVRDEINDTDPAFVNELQQIGDLGYGLCGLIGGGDDYPPIGERLKASAVVPMIQNLLPTIEAVEGPNEPDDGGFVYEKKEVPYPKGAIDESKDLWNIVKGSPEINALPVVVMSEGNAPDFKRLARITPPPIDYATYGNMHAYQGGGVGDNGLVSYYMPYARDLTGKDLLWTTEMGYHNNTQFLSNGEQQGVSPRAAAIYLPIAFLSGFTQGVLRTFSYELIDEFYDPQFTSGSGEGHYGLLNYDGTWKPAFTALKNLAALLHDPDEQFQPGSLAITFEGAPATMQYTLLQKANGDYYLALWNDTSICQVATSPTSPGQDLYPANVPVIVTFSEPHRLTVYAPNDASGVRPTDSYTLSTTDRSILIDLPAKVLLLRIGKEEK
jgi:hypothetical protein